MRILKAMSILCAVMVLIGTPAIAAITYVDAASTGTETGADWCHAYHDLQDAITAVWNGNGATEIRVAGGTYKPGGQRTDAFHLLNDLAIMGGYAGCTGIDPNARNAVSILSGDIDNDGWDDGDSYSVVRAEDLDEEVPQPNNETAVLDGFTITRGYGGTSGKGAGIYARYQSSPTISNCSIVENWADDQGGGFYGNNSGSEIRACQFTDNKAGDASGEGGNAGDGGGICLANSSTARILGCTFDGNVAAGVGGGACVDATAGFVAEDCTFVNNASLAPGSFALAMGGGMFLTGSLNPRLQRCLFEDNHADRATAGGGGEGGALWVETDPNPTSLPAVVDCEFIDNYVDDENGIGRGGAIWTHHSCDVFNTTFSGNETRNGEDIDGVGGAWYCQTKDFSAPNRAVNCLFYGNNSGKGGAFYSHLCSADMFNCTMAENTAVTDGGGVYLEDMAVQGFGTPHFNVVNCILWDNTDSGGDDEEAQFYINDGTPVIKYTDIENLNLLADTGNIDADPEFVSPGSPNYDYRLSACGTVSPCIDAGSDGIPDDEYNVDRDAFTTTEPTPDLDYHDRVFDMAGVSNVTAVPTDMGAFEASDLVLVDIQLEGTYLEDATSDGVLNRCIRFEVWSCSGSSPDATVDQVVAFPLGQDPIVYNVPVILPLSCDGYTCMTAKDRWHTLRSTAGTFTDVGDHYYATFTGSWGGGGHWLKPGDVNNSGVVTGIDLGWLVYDRDHGPRTFTNGDVGCDWTYPSTRPNANTDLNGDGVVTQADVDMASANSALSSQTDCCSEQFAGFGGGSEAFDVSVEDLMEIGLSGVEEADANKDGMIDFAEFGVFLR